MNWKGCCRTRSWPNLRYYPGIYPERPRKTTKKLSQDSRSLGRDLISGPPEYEAGVLTTRPRRSAHSHFVLFTCPNIHPHYFLSFSLLFSQSYSLLLVHLFIHLYLLLLIRLFFVFLIIILFYYVSFHRLYIFTSRFSFPFRTYKTATSVPSSSDHP
jgi:hypothetical protein